MSRPMAVWLAAALAALTIATTVRQNTFTPWGTDAASYIEAAHRWEQRELFTPLPLQLWSPPLLNDWNVAPHGFRSGVERGTEVDQYPLGLPVLMAAAIRLGGPLAAYLVVPVSAGLLVWCAYLLGSHLGGDWAGLLAAVVVAASPIVLVMAVQPMSDVPAAALWALSWAMSLRPGFGASAAAGAAASAAIMIRPNLAPLCLIIAALQFVQRNRNSAAHTQRWGPMAVFLTVAAVGPLIVGWSQAVLYGSPFRSGYLGQDSILSLSYAPASLLLYPRLLIAAHTPLIFAGLFIGPLLWWSPFRRRVAGGARLTALSAVAFVLVNYLLYLPTVPLPDPGAVRYVLPAFTALVVLFAGLLGHVGRALASTSRMLLLLCLVPAVMVVAHPWSAVRYAMDLHNQQAQVRIAGPYLEAALPANAAIITSVQGTALSHYTKRMIVRFDALQQAALDATVDELRRRGYRPVFVMEGDAEANWFRAHFASSPLGKLDWPARAVALGLVKYWDPADREAYARGTRWTTDTLSLRQ